MFKRTAVDLVAEFSAHWKANDFAAEKADIQFLAAHETERIVTDILVGESGEDIAWPRSDQAKTYRGIGDVAYGHAVF